jgi:hypothetical protein
MNPEVAFQPTNFKPVGTGTCYKAAHDTINCQTDGCDCGTTHTVSIPGDIVSSGNNPSDKFLFCCTKNGFQCVIAYTGVAPGCQ